MIFVILLVIHNFFLLYHETLYVIYLNQSVGVGFILLLPIY